MSVSQLRKKINFKIPRELAKQLKSFAETEYLLFTHYVKSTIFKNIDKVDDKVLNTYWPEVSDFKLSFSVNKDEDIKIRNIAKENNINVSKFLRSILLNHIKNNIKRKRKKP